MSAGTSLLGLQHMPPSGASPRPAARLPWRWLAYAAALLAAPWLFSSTASALLLSQMACAIVLCLSYNMLLGQGGMLSFGHAVYAGLGAYATAHAMNAAGGGAIWLPVVLAPLAGAAAGLAAGLVFGYVCTRKSGTAFAMITFGIGELVHVAASMFPEIFGGETGISTTRVYGTPWWGINFGPARQAYYLIAAWTLLATLLMFALTRTPLGAMANAVRDNAERARFVGYNPHRVRHSVFALSAAFAGLAGGLAALNFEIVTAEGLSTAQSGAVLLFTYIGGTSRFFGPVTGAVVGTLLTVSASTWTPAWPLYLGLFFIAVVKWAPGGIAGMAAALGAMVRDDTARPILPALALLMVSLAVALAGSVLMIELAYQVMLQDGGASAEMFTRLGLGARQLRTWAGAGAVAAAGIVASVLAARAFAQRRDAGRQSGEKARAAGAAEG